ncbi:MAG: DUF3786 domain-containing protein [Negativicutes bacterium]|nr:DUF3786 domain-containing protein [Negativicutes bacterium]
MPAADLQPDNLKKAYELAYRKACEEFRRWDPADMAASSGSSFDAATKTISLRYVSDQYKVAFPSGEVAFAHKNEAVPTTVKVVLLHYLVRAGGQPLKNEVISFKEIPQGGMLYIDAFNKRIINYLTAVFAGQPAMLVQAGVKLGGGEAGRGDFAVRLDILPRLPVTFVLWSGDEEFPPAATVLFDATAPFYLPTEDLVVATGFCVGQLARAARQLKEAGCDNVPADKVLAMRKKEVRV